MPAGTRTIWWTAVVLALAVITPACYAQFAQPTPAGASPHQPRESRGKRDASSAIHRQSNERGQQARRSREERQKYRQAQQALRQERRNKAARQIRNRFQSTPHITPVASTTTSALTLPAAAVTSATTVTSESLVTTGALGLVPGATHSATAPAGLR